MILKVITFLCLFIFSQSIFATTVESVKNPVKKQTIKVIKKTPIKIVKKVPPKQKIVMTNSGITNTGSTANTGSVDSYTEFVTKLFQDKNQAPIFQTKEEYATFLAKDIQNVVKQSTNYSNDRGDIDTVFGNITIMRKVDLQRYAIDTNSSGNTTIYMYVTNVTGKDIDYLKFNLKLKNNGGEYIYGYNGSMNFSLSSDRVIKNDESTLLEFPINTANDNWKSSSQRASIIEDLHIVKLHFVSGALLENKIDLIYK